MIPRRGFFSQLAGLFAGVPALLGMKPKVTEHRLDGYLTISRHPLSWLDHGAGLASWVNWVPVSERLPRDRMGVITLQHDHETLWYDFGIIENGKWKLLGENNSKAAPPSIPVSFWAELPAPPIPLTDNATGIMEYQVDFLTKHAAITREEAEFLRAKITKRDIGL